LQRTMPDRRAAAQVALNPELYAGYRLHGRRGQSTFGQVWEAEADDGATVALKFLPCPGDRAIPELRSLQLVRQLVHPGLVRIHKVWSASRCLVVAMDLADGSVADLVDAYRVELGTAMPRDHLLLLLAQAAQALDFLNTCQHYLHDQWVTVQHLHVTPTSLLVFGETVRLSDFGLATTLTAHEKCHHRAGAPAYAAPEVFQGRVSDRTDQYALAVCYCLLRGGRLPFRDTPAAFEATYVRPAPDLGMLDAEERPAIARALAPVPRDRWPSCGELVDQLAQAGRPGTPPGERPERRQAPRHRPAAVVACEVLPTLDNQPWQAEVQNVSAGGVRLRVHQPGCPLRPGRVLELALVKPAQGLRVPVRLRLTHSAEREGGDYEVGGAFDRPLSPGEVEALSGHGLAGPVKFNVERRFQARTAR
jgi:serine/threonine-protein kinase